MREAGDFWRMPRDEGTGAAVGHRRLPSERRLCRLDRRRVWFAGIGRTMEWRWQIAMVINPVKMLATK